MSLRFVGGTLELRGWPSTGATPGEPWAWDPREACYRSPAHVYAEVRRRLAKEGVPVTDEARAYAELDLPAVGVEPRPYQREALQAWLAARGAGVVVLPTGAGKTLVALLAIHAKQRGTLVVAPTLELVRQWHGLLEARFGAPIGVLGGGEHVVEPITVTTYDSAYLHVERLGARFGLVVFDECHHLPSESYALIARMSLAPFRLGLTATLERADGRESLLEELVGPVVYEKQITELAGEYLAEYETRRIVVELTESERAEYEQARATYVAFVRKQGIVLGSPRGFSDFILRASRTEEGRRALEAHRRQRALALAAEGKFRALEELLARHPERRTIVFTQDNRTAYEVSRRFLVPIITHQTKTKERTEILRAFDEGRYGVIVTSKVLNEGVDVPSASMAVVLSGSGSVMEHVQRLGRILRRQGDKDAILYELVSGKTGESKQSDRRREHAAYRGPGGFWRKGR